MLKIMSCSLQSPSKETTAIISASRQLSVRGGYVWCRITQSCQLLCLSFLEIRPSSFSSSTRNTASYGASLTFSKCKIRSFESGSRRSHNFSVLPSQVPFIHQPCRAGFFPAKHWWRRALSKTRSFDIVKKGIGFSNPISFFQGTVRKKRRIMDARKSTCPLPLPPSPSTATSKWQKFFPGKYIKTRKKDIGACLNFQIGGGCPEPITFYITRRTTSYFELPSDHKILNQRKKMTNTIHLNEIADALMICTAVRISMKLKAHH